MLRETRLRQIMELLLKDGKVENRELCELLGVSDMTIRRDLDSLAENGEIVRTRGGALLKHDVRKNAAERNLSAALIIGGWCLSVPCCLRTH